MMERALSEGRAFNLIHIGTAVKVDVFPATTEFHQTQLERARKTVLPAPISLECMVTTAEDILLAKLRWYTDGGCISERQWNDITLLLATNPELDWIYVNDWASRLGVSEHLQKARADASS